MACQTLLSVDDQVAAIVQALSDTGRLHDTMIVFASDNGLLFGEHRWDGQERSVRRVHPHPDRRPRRRGDPAEPCRGRPSPDADHVPRLHADLPAGGGPRPAPWTASRCSRPLGGGGTWVPQDDILIEHSENKVGGSSHRPPGILRRAGGGVHVHAVSNGRGGAVRPVGRSRPDGERGRRHAIQCRAQSVARDDPSAVRSSAPENTPGSPSLGAGGSRVQARTGPMILGIDGCSVAASRTDATSSFGATAGASRHGSEQGVEHHRVRARAAVPGRHVPGLAAALRAAAP